MKKVPRKQGTSRLHSGLRLLVSLPSVWWALVFIGVTAPGLIPPTARVTLGLIVIAQIAYELFYGQQGGLDTGVEKKEIPMISHLKTIFSPTSSKLMTISHWLSFTLCLAVTAFPLWLPGSQNLAYTWWSIVLPMLLIAYVCTKEIIKTYRTPNE